MPPWRGPPTPITPSDWSCCSSACGLSPPPRPSGRAGRGACSSHWRRGCSRGGSSATCSARPSPASTPRSASPPSSEPAIACLWPPSCSWRSPQAVPPSSFPRPPRRRGVPAGHGPGVGLDVPASAGSRPPRGAARSQDHLGPGHRRAHRALRRRAGGVRVVPMRWVVVSGRSRWWRGPTGIEPA